ncbi:MAG: DnaJ domain-containing protein [Spirochaetales bacterium]|nr:DnaJ domain-containing protein [Spirochaetales bacterium]
MTVNDCFRILELPRTAGIDELKFAYRTMAKKYHPDRKGGDSRKFTRLHEAYEFLLDYGPFKSGFTARTVNPSAGETGGRTAEEKKRREEELYRRRQAEMRRKEEERESERRAAEEKKKQDIRESVRRAAEERKRRQEAMERERRKADAKGRRDKEEKLRKDADRLKNPVHLARLAGEVLSGNKPDRDKLKAIETLVSLKRKSAYPYLKKGFYNSSEKVTAASIRAVGLLQIVQAGPELTSLMCSGSPLIRKAVLDAVSSFRNPSLFRSIIELGLSDRDKSLQAQAEQIRSRFNG